LQLLKEDMNGCAIWKTTVKDAEPR